MKKVIAIVMAMVMMFALSGCMISEAVEVSFHPEKLIPQKWYLTVVSVDRNSDVNGTIISCETGDFKDFQKWVEKAQTDESVVDYDYEFEYWEDEYYQGYIYAVGIEYENNCYVAIFSDGDPTVYLNSCGVY